MYRKSLLILTFLFFSLPQLACRHSAEQVTATSAATPGATATPASGPGEMRTAPSGLKYQDLVIGAGRRPILGQMVTVKYVGKLENGQVFDEGSFEYKLGDPGIIKGFNLGIAGGEGIDAMKVDGKRLIILPPELGYGKEGDPPKIPANATLTFEIELLKAQGGMGF